MMLSCALPECRHVVEAADQDQRLHVQRHGDGAAERVVAHLHRVVALAGQFGHGFGVRDQRVEVVARAADQGGAARTEEDVVAFAAVDQVAAASAIHRVVAGQGIDQVVGGVARNEIVARGGRW
jgi:hypothetical protein